MYSPEGRVTPFTITRDPKSRDIHCQIVDTDIGFTSFFSSALLNMSSNDSVSSLSFDFDVTCVNFEFK